MKNVIVTGGAGFIGSKLCNQLSEEGYNVFSFDTYAQYSHPPIRREQVYNINYRFEKLLSKCQLVRCSTVNKDDLRRRVNEIEPDFIVHFAALPLANVAIEYPEEAFTSIVEGTFNLLEICRDQKNLKNFVYISSSMVYGDFENFPVKESAQTRPKEIYGGMKLAGEGIVRCYGQRYKVPYSIARPSAVYGPSDNNGRVLAKFIENAIKGTRLRAVNPDQTKLDFTYVDDAAMAVRNIMINYEKSITETFNITRGEGRTLREALNIIAEIYPKIEIDIEEKDTFHPKRGALDISKCRTLLGHEPKISLEQGIKVYSQFMEESLK